MEELPNIESFRNRFKEIENQLAAYSKAITCIMSFAFVVFSVVSFIKARRANEIGPS